MGFPMLLRVNALALASGVLLVFASERAAAQAPADEAWPYERGGVAFDAGLVAAMPAALPTGLARGIGAGVQSGRCIAWGVRAAWTSTEESSDVWQVTHDEIRLVATGALRREVGRATLALRGGIGGALVYESRRRQQGMRAGLQGDELETTNLALLPVSRLDAVVTLHVHGAWALQLGGGPGLIFLEGGARATWSAELGVAWHR